MGKPIIGLIKSKDRYQSVSGSLNLIRDQIARRIKGKKRIVIKVNFVCADNQLSSTHVETTRAVLDFLKPLYRGKIFVVEKGIVCSGRGFANFSYTPLLRDYNINLGDYSKYGFERIRIFDVNLKKCLFVYLSKLALSSDFLISITPAKTHDVGIVTLGLKNVAVGFLKNPSIIHQGYRAFNKNLYLLIQRLQPDLSIIDATVAMEGNGPCLGLAKEAGWSLVSLDGVQADVVASHLMGFDPQRVGYLFYCLENGLATDDWGKIEVLGEKIENCRGKFKAHNSFREQLKWLEPPSLKEKIRAKIVTNVSPFLKTEIGKKLDNSLVKKIAKRLLGFQ